MSSSVDSDHLKFTDPNHEEQREVMVLSDLDTRHKEDDHVSFVLYGASGKPMGQVSMKADDAMSLAVALFRLDTQTWVTVRDSALEEAAELFEGFARDAMANAPPETRHLARDKMLAHARSIRALKPKPAINETKNSGAAAYTGLIAPPNDRKPARSHLESCQKDAAHEGGCLQISVVVPNGGGRPTIAAVGPRAQEAVEALAGPAPQPSGNPGELPKAEPKWLSVDEVEERERNEDAARILKEHGYGDVKVVVTDRFSETVHDFGWALQQMRAGKKVRREHWDREGYAGCWWLVKADDGTFWWRSSTSFGTSANMVPAEILATDWQVAE